MPCGSKAFASSIGSALVGERLRHRVGNGLREVLVQVRHRRGDHVVRAESELRAFVAGLVSDAVSEGSVRTDIPPDEAAIYCLHALGAAAALSSRAALARLVAVTLDALRPGH